MNSRQQLFLRILWESFAALCLHELLIRANDGFQIFARQIDVIDHMGFFLLLIKDRVEFCLGNSQNHIAEHLYETTVAVQREPSASGQRGQSLDALIVQSQIQNGIHHTGHRDRGARAHRNKQRIFLAAKGLAGDMLQILNFFCDSGADILRDGLIFLIIAATRLRRYGKAERNGQPDPAHFRKIRALAAEQLTHILRAFIE